MSDNLRDALDQDEGLAEWLYNRFSSRRGADSAPWVARTPETHGYWEHEAEAVRRAVAAAHPVEPAGVSDEVVQHAVIAAARVPAYGTPEGVFDAMRAALEAALPYLTLQPVASREAVRSLIGAASPDLAAYPDRLDYVTDAVLALLDGTAS